MKSRMVVLFFAVVSALLLASCTGPLDDGTGAVYQLYKNFASVPAKAAGGLSDGEEIIGVLLKYTSEGAYDVDVAPVDSQTFCVYCLFDDHGMNGDGMEFNYVLYVPQDIQDQFQAGGGHNPKSGDPFWWYMSTYLGQSLETIHGDWTATIGVLCSGAELPKADAADIGTWNQ